MWPLRIFCRVGLHGWDYSRPPCRLDALPGRLVAAVEEYRRVILVPRLRACGACRRVEAWVVDDGGGRWEAR